MDGKNTATTTAPERKYVGFYVGSDTRDALAKIAKEKQMSLSDVARIAAIEYVARNGDGQN